jgi:glycine/D-amino acid oxidase-like deaminating enzyme
MAISRRMLLAVTGVAAAGVAGVSAARWWGGEPPLADADRAAHSAHDLFDRGLVPLERSGWTMPEGVKPPYPALTADIETDVLVVGAGLAGSSLALHLAEAGISVTVLEARQPGWGASGRNAGHVLPTLRDASVFEAFPDKGKRFLEAFAEHHTIPFDLQAKHGFAADAVKSGYINAGTSADAIARFRQQTAWMEERGMLKVAEVGGEELRKATGSDHWSHALDYLEGGRVNPYRMTNGMAAAAAKFGARIFGNSPATQIAPVGQRWRVQTAKGSVTADRVVFCTNAYATDVVPEFANSFYPLTAYALTTKPLAPAARQAIMPGGQTLAQVPIDLNPLVVDEHGRLVLSSIPSVNAAENAHWHFANQLDWVHSVWPESRGMGIELEAYWTGRVALRDREFPGVFEVKPGLYGLMFFNAWGNVMAPLMGKLFAAGLASDRMGELPFPMEKPVAVANMGKQDRIIRHLLIPSARQAQRRGII